MKLINEQAQVCDIFNDFFVNVAKDIGQNSISIDENHPSVYSMNQNKKHDVEFSFNPVSDSFISKQIDKLSSKKATGHDGISAKLLKYSKPSVIKPITTMVNLSLNLQYSPIA